IAGMGGAGQSGIRRPTGLTPSINPASLNRPAGSNLAQTSLGNRTNWGAGNGLTIGGNRNLTGLNSQDGSRIPYGRPDVGGGRPGRNDTVFKPDLSNPDRPIAGTLPVDRDRPGSDRPGSNRPDWNNRPDWANRPGRPGWGNRPGGGIAGNGNWNSG